MSNPTHPPVPGVYRNNKTGGHYLVLREAIDCTNERDGTRVLIYKAFDASGSLYVRDAEQFMEKFTLVSD
ncbi:hypothetical protein [Thioalkalivibrio thiocyanodenitrificans]|uniref:hypothetical protein n=1 Tax=Thioalkalivibrio thiocyanodenitrificans TaxID=243063 RepID=UPI000523FA5D|nr:hypothetical protein [Thioalkalivibrio thiocyanodenitrificans]